MYNCVDKVGFAGVNTFSLDEVDFLRENEQELTAFEVRAYTKMTLDIIKTMFVKDLETNKLKVLSVVDRILLNVEVVDMLTLIRQLDDYTFEHSVNVCVVSLFAAVLMGYDEDRLFELGAGAILHDVGKVKVKECILKKPGKLTKEEYEEIKLHTKYGYEMICECKSLSKRSAYIANAHHERINGNGYPIGLSGYQISEEARIVAISDVYDALVSDRIYRSKMWPGEVIDYILSQESGYLDEEILRMFIKFVAVYPIGTSVLLSNNKKGVVIKDNFIIPSKPIVKLFNDENLVFIYEHELDLSKNKDLYISKAVDG